MDYILKRSKRKTLSLSVTAALEVVVRAPARLKKEEIDRFVARHELWILRQKERQESYASAHPEPTKEELAALFCRAKEYIPARVEHFSEKMGLFPTAVKITGAKTRFGSCSPKNSLAFSARLMLYPPSAVDYVVVHELSHIAHKNHGKDFYAQIEGILPDYKARRALLKK